MGFLFLTLDLTEYDDK